MKPEALLPCPCGGRPVLIYDDYINGRVIADPDVFVECCGSMLQWCGRSTFNRYPNIKDPIEAGVRWNELVRSILEGTYIPDEYDD
jgi:hypothetical protein